MESEGTPLLSYSGLDAAYWKWVEESCPHPPYSKERTAWLRSNHFPFDGTLWARSATPMLSNSGKSVRAWSVVYRGEDGRHVARDALSNRRNSPERNWGLGRE